MEGHHIRVRWDGPTVKVNCRCERLVAARPLPAWQVGNVQPIFRLELQSLLAPLRLGPGKTIALGSSHWSLGAGIVNGETGPEQWSTVVQARPCRKVETMVARPPCASTLFTPTCRSRRPPRHGWHRPVRSPASCARPTPEQPVRTLSRDLRRPVAPPNVLHFLPNGARTKMKVPTRSYRLTLAVALWAGTLTGVLSSSVTSAAAAAPATLDLNVLLIGGAHGPDHGGVAIGTEQRRRRIHAGHRHGQLWLRNRDAAGPDHRLSRDLNGVVVADSPAEFAAGQLSALDTYEATFGVDQVDGYTYPYLGETDVSAGALDGTTGQLTAAGLAALPELAGPVPFATGSYGYPSAVNAGAPFTPWLENTAGNVLAGVYQHPSTDPQAGVPEVELNFNYSSSMLQWLLLAPGLINWVTQGTHLGLYRNFIEMDIDDTFTPDNAWSTAVHDNDYSDASSLRMAARRGQCGEMVPGDLAAH